MLEDMTVHAARDLASGAAARLTSRGSIPRLQGLAAGFGLTCGVFPADALPRGVCARPGEDQPVTFAAGGKDAVERMRDAVARGDRTDVLSALNLPICCARCANLPHPGGAAIAAISTMAAGDGTELVLPASLSAHPLLAPMGLWVLPILPCAPDCAGAADSAERWLRRACDHGYDEEVEWLRACLSWAMVWSELHGVIERRSWRRSIGNEWPSPRPMGTIRECSWGSPPPPVCGSVAARREGSRVLAMAPWRSGQPPCVA
jgi:hypothetical protein